MTSLKALTSHLIHRVPATAQGPAPGTTNRANPAAQRAVSENKALAHLSQIHAAGTKGPAAAIAKLQADLDKTNQQISSLTTKIAGEDPKAPGTRKDKHELAHLKQHAKNVQLHIYQILYPPPPKPHPVPGMGMTAMPGFPAFPGNKPGGATGLAPIGTPAMPPAPGSGSKPTPIGPDAGKGQPDPYPFQPPWLVVPNTTQGDFPDWQMGDPWQVPPGFQNPGTVGAPPLFTNPFSPNPTDPFSPTNPFDPGGDDGEMGGDGGGE